MRFRKPLTENANEGEQRTNTAQEAVPGIHHEQGEHGHGRP